MAPSMRHPQSLEICKATDLPLFLDSSGLVTDVHYLMLFNRFMS